MGEYVGERFLANALPYFIGQRVMLLRG